MAKKRLEEVIVAEHVLEVRTEASGYFLDVRGYLADFVRADGFFPHWQIEDNIVRFFDQERRIEKLGAFVGYRSIGFVAYNPDTRNFFPDKATSFWKHIEKNKHYSIPAVLRFGSRTRAFLSADVQFSVLVERVVKRFFTPTAAQLGGTEPTDLQVVLDSNEAGFRTRIVLGPVKPDESSRYFNFPSSHFASPGVFVDIDCFMIDGLKQEQVPNLLRRSMDVIWARVEKVAAALEI